MRILALLFFLFVHVSGFTQITKGQFYLEPREATALSINRTELLHFFGNINLSPPIAVRGKSSSDSTFLLDSSYTSRYNSPTDFLLIRKYYEYDAIGNNILEDIISPCFTCVSVLPGKREREFDANRNCTKNIWYELMPSNEYLPLFKIEQIFDLYNRQISYLQFLWDKVTSEWDNQYKTEYIYFDDTASVHTISFQWNADNHKWENTHKTDKNFDKDGNILMQASYDYNKSSEQWSGRDRSEYTYNDSNLTAFTEFKWDSESSNWVNLQKTEYCFDSIWNNTSDIIYNWDSAEGLWKQYVKYEYSMADNGKIEVNTTFTMDNVNQWIEAFKVEYDYDINENEILRLSFAWDTINNKWINQQKYEWEYDVYNSMILSVYYLWDQELNYWIPVIKNEFKFDDYGNKIQDFSYSWDSNTGQWISYYKSEFFYSLHQITSNTEFHEIDNIEIYPNPATGFITIAVPPGNGGKYQLRLTDLQGRIVLLKEEEITGSCKLDLPATKPGIYILEIKNETTEVSKRIILQ